MYNKSNKSGDLHLKIAQPTKKQETGDKMCSWGHDCLESLCQGQDPVKGQQLFSLSEQRWELSAGQKLSELNRSITNYGHEVYFN